jgi:hypothetical protein
MATQADPSTGDPVGRTEIYVDDGSGNAKRVNATQPLPVSASPAYPTNTWPNTPTNITAANADTALLASNTNRKGVVISNDSTAKLYVLADGSGSGAASATNFTYVVGPGLTLELPIASDIATPTARLRGFWSAAQGSAAVSEVT